MKRTLSFVFLLSTLLAFTSGAQADNTACTGAIFLVPDGSPHEGMFAVNLEQRWYRAVVKVNRSYVIVVENLSPTDTSGFVAISSLLGGSCMGTTLPTAPGSTTEPVSADSGVGAIRLAFTVNSNAAVFFPLDGTMGTKFRVRVEETTLFNPLWSTFGGFETFYRFQNSTNSACSVTLRMVNDAGTVVANSTQPIPANSTAPTVFTGPMAQGGLNLANDQAGGATITHNCPPGAIQVDGFTGRFDLAAPVVLPIKIQTARQMR